MARTRRKLDTFQEAAAVEKRLKAEPPGWRRERLMAVQLGLAGELNLEEIANAVGRVVRVWVMDEMRFGLHSFTRKVWITGKQRPVAPSQKLAHPKQTSSPIFGGDPETQ